MLASAMLRMSICRDKKRTRDGLTKAVKIQQSVETQLQMQIAAPRVKTQAIPKTCLC